MCLSAVDEPTLKTTGSSDAFKQQFGDWLSERQTEARAAGAPFIVLKYPPSAFLIPEINAVCQPRWLAVHRPFDKIEATRMRRGWYAYLGSAGASKIYGSLYSRLIEQELSCYNLSFSDFLNNPRERQNLVAALSLHPSSEALDHAEAWIA